MSDVKYKYNAFISYSQDPDKKLAWEIENKLEKFGLGWHRLKRQQLYIFRDVTDLSLTRDLGAKIKEGLEQSEFLILLAQKKLSLSTLNWVNQEAEYFINVCEQRHIDPADNIILVITDGEIEWDRIANNWNFEKTDVLPRIVQNLFIVQPLYVDLRGLKNAISLRSKKQLFSEALIVIIARLLKKKPSEIQNMVIQLQRIVIGISVVIALIMFGLTIFSVMQSMIAKVNEKKATVNAMLAKVNEKLAKVNEGKAKANAFEAKENEKIAKTNEQNAIHQKNRADSLRRVADTNNQQTIRALLDVTKQKTLADKRKLQADSANNRTDTLNKLLTAENLSITYGNYLSKLNGNKNKTLTTYTDSVLEAYRLFYAYYKPNKKDHFHKLESIYTGLQAAYISNLNSEINLDRNYSHILTTDKATIYLLNSAGKTDRFIVGENRIDSSFTGIKTKGIYEIIPVSGTNYSLYSLKNNDWEVFDVEQQKRIPIEGKNLNFQSILTMALFDIQNHIIRVSNKQGYIQNIVSTTSGKLSIMSSTAYGANINAFYEDQNTRFILFANGKFKASKLCQTCHEPGILNISSFATSLNQDIIYMGCINGTLLAFNIQTGQEVLIATLNNRINRILWCDKEKILIVQEGANHIELFKQMDTTIVRLFRSSFGQQINDLTVDKNGVLYILYNKNKLQWWNIDDQTMVNNLKNMHNPIIINDL